MSTVLTIQEQEVRTTERRSCTRKPLPWVVLVYFGQSNWGKLIDLSDKGMSFEFDRAPSLDEQITFTLEGMGATPTLHGGEVFSDSFQATGQAVWTREFERVAGVQFLNVEEQSRDQIRQWLSWDASRDAAASRNQLEGADTKETPARLVSTESALSTSVAGMAKSAENVESLNARYERAKSKAESRLESGKSLTTQANNTPVPGNAEKPRKEKVQNRDKKPVFHLQWPTTAVFSALTCLAILAGVKIAPTLSRESKVGGNAPSPLADRPVPGQEEKSSRVEKARPFQVEVLDAENRRQLLSFEEDSHRGASAVVAKASGLPVAAPSLKKTPETTMASIGGARETTHDFTLASPHVGQPKANAIDVSPFLPAAPPMIGEAGLGNIVSAGALHAPVKPGSRLGGDVQPARLIRAVQPVYPETAKATHVAGDVTLEALIDAAGDVNSVRVISGPDPLHEVAMNALKDWKYEPARLNGLPTPSHLTITMKFRIR